jgi:hypothetical protein
MMRKVGIEAAVRAATVQESSMQTVDREGRVKAFFPANRSGRAGIASRASLRLCAAIWSGFCTG